MFGIRTDYQQWRQAMSKLRSEALPATIANTLNRMAFGAFQRQEILEREMFTLRNQYVERGNVYYKATPRPNINSINAIVGHRAQFMADQEMGATRRAKSRALAIPTLKGSRAGDVRNVIPAALRMKALGKVAGLGTGTYRNRAGKTIHQRGHGFFFLPGAHGHKAGIFRRVGGDVVMVRDLSKHSYVIKPRHFHTEAVRQFGTRANLERIFIAEAKKEIGRYQPR